MTYNGQSTDMIITGMIIVSLCKLSIQFTILIALQGIYYNFGIHITSNTEYVCSSHIKRWPYVAVLHIYITECLAFHYDTTL